VGTAAAMVQKALERVNTGDGVVILTDMFGGTPTNIASTFLNPGKVEIVTGVNLPMLIKLAQVSLEEPLASVARLLRDTGQSSIYIASELLAPKKQA
jgi:PTS system mannose-specific IIA component